MKGRYLILATVALGALVLFAGYAEYPRATSTKVASIVVSPNDYNGKQVSLFGTVIDRSDNGFTLADGTGSIRVRWSGTLPAVGAANVFVQGVVSGVGVEFGGFNFDNAVVTATSVSVWPV